MPRRQVAECVARGRGKNGGAGLPALLVVVPELVLRGLPAARPSIGKRIGTAPCFLDIGDFRAAAVGYVGGLVCEAKSGQDDGENECF